MSTANAYEVFNDFLMFRDPTHVIQLGTHLEVFSSSSISDGKIYLGEEAPIAFRKAISNYAKSLLSSLKHDGILTVMDSGDSAIFVTKTKGKLRANVSSLVITSRLGLVTGFMERKSA